MQIWEKILLGIVALVVVLWLGPGLRARGNVTQKAGMREWMSVLVPLAVVALFVVALLRLT